jgi:hypothetical protein
MNSSAYLLLEQASRVTLFDMPHEFAFRLFSEEALEVVMGSWLEG